MNKVMATPAPKAKYPKLFVFPYAYAATLTILAVAALMGLGGFDFAHISYETPGIPVLAVAIAGLQIFALPFLLRLPLSNLARFFSATFALIAPFFLLGNIAYLMSQQVVVTNAAVVAGGVLLIVLGVASFAVLDGQKALRLKAK